MKSTAFHTSSKLPVAVFAALAGASVAHAAQSAPAASSGGWAAVGGSVGGLLLGVIQLIVGLSLAAFSITKGLQLLSKLLGGIDIWAEIKSRNVAVALLAGGVVISYTRVISGGIDAMTRSLLTLGTGGVLNGVIGLVAGVINLVVAIGVASFAITVVFRVMDKLTAGIDERAEFKGGNPAIMIPMAMGKDDACNGPITQRLADQLHTGGGRLNRSQRIHNDPACLTPDDRHHRNIIASNLVDTGHNLKQPMLNIELGLTPKRGVHTGWSITFDKGVGIGIPNNIPLGIADDATFNLRNAPTRRVGKIGWVI